MKIPAEALIKVLAREKRDLQIENLDLRRENEILKEDLAEFKQRFGEAMPVRARDINKCINQLQQIYAQFGKKWGLFSEMVTVTTQLNNLLETLLQTTKKDETDENSI